MELKGNPQLVEAFRRGEREVLAGLYREHAGAVAELLQMGFSFVSKGKTVRFRGFVEPFRLQEALQDSFIHAFRRNAREAYDGSQRYRPYLLTIVRNRLIDGFRRERLEASLFVHVEDVRFEGEGADEVYDRVSGASSPARPSPEQAAARQELATILERFVADLDAEDTAVVERHLMGELTQQEMADALGTDRNDVRKRIRLIRQRLLRHLKSEGIIGALDKDEVFRALQTLLILRVSS